MGRQEYVNKYGGNIFLIYYSKNTCIVDIFIICNMENWKYGGKTFQKATLACLFIREFRVLQITEANPKLIGHMILK